MKLDKSDYVPIRDPLTWPNTTNNTCVKILDKKTLQTALTCLEFELKNRFICSLSDDECECGWKVDLIHSINVIKELLNKIKHQ